MADGMFPLSPPDDWPECPACREWQRVVWPALDRHWEEREGKDG